LAPGSIWRPGLNLSPMRLIAPLLLTSTMPMMVAMPLRLIILSAPVMPLVLMILLPMVFLYLHALVLVLELATVLALMMVVAVVWWTMEEALTLSASAGGCLSTALAGPTSYVAWRGPLALSWKPPERGWRAGSRRRWCLAICLKLRRRASTLAWQWPSD
jgi:hypothetical protein